MLGVLSVEFSCHPLICFVQNNKKDVWIKKLTNPEIKLQLAGTKNMIGPQRR
jgi:hypothetical protein